VHKRPNGNIVVRGQTWDELTTNVACGAGH
jgi:hypothetical protein